MLKEVVKSAMVIVTFQTCTCIIEYVKRIENVSVNQYKPIIITCRFLFWSAEYISNKYLQINKNVNKLQH